MGTSRLVAGAILLFFAGAVALLSSTIIVAMPTGDYGGGTALAGLTAIGFLFITRNVFGNSRGFLDLIFWYLVTFSLLWVGFLQVSTGKFSWEGFYYKQYLAATILVLVLFCVSYEFGFIIQRRPLPSATKSSNSETPITFTARFKFSLTVLFIASLLCAAYVGPGILFSSRGDVSDALTDKGNAYPLFAGKSAALTGFSLCLFAFRNFSLVQGRHHRQGLPYLLAFLSLIAIWYYPPAETRAQILAVGLIAGIYILGNPTPLKKAMFVSSLWIGNIFALGPLKALLGGGRVADSSASVQTYLFRVDFDSFEIINSTFKYVERHSYFYLSNVVAALLFFVPRVLWPSKPPGTSNIVMAALGFPYTNVSFPLPAEFYVAGGFPAVAILAFFLGRMIAKFDIPPSADLANVNRTYASVVGALGVAYSPIIFRGALGSVLPFFGLSFLFLGMIYLFCRRDQKLQANPEIALAKSFDRGRINVLRVQPRARLPQQN